MSAEGEILSEWFGRSVIRSCVKLAYEHAQVNQCGGSGSVTLSVVVNFGNLKSYRYNFVVVQSLIDQPERVDWAEGELPTIGELLS